MKIVVNYLTICSVSGPVSFSRILVEMWHSLLPDSDGPVPLQLPEQWLWDIIDEFIYQFQSFCVWRSKVKSKSDDELILLADGSSVGEILTSQD